MAREWDHRLGDVVARVGEQARAEHCDLRLARAGANQHPVTAALVRRFDDQLVEVLEDVRELVGVARQIGRHIAEDRLLPQVIADDGRHIVVDDFVVGHAGADRVGQGDVAGAHSAEEARDAEDAVRAEGEGVEELIVDPAVDHVDRLAPPRGPQVDAVVDDEEVAPLDQLDPHLLGQEGVLEVGRVVDARREEHDGRTALAARGRARGEAAQVLDQLAGVMVDRADAQLREPVGEDARHRRAVGEDVRDAAGGTEIVLQHEVAPLRVAHEVAADDVDVLVVRHVDPHDLAPEVASPDDQAARHHAVAQDFSLVVDIVDEAVQRLDALPQARFDQLPLRGRDEARDEVEGEDTLRPLLLVRVDGEGDALVEEGTVGEIPCTPEIARAQVRQLRGERAVVWARHQAAVREGHEHLVVEGAGLVARDERVADDRFHGAALPNDGSTSLLSPRTVGDPEFRVLASDLPSPRLQFGVFSPS